MAEEEKKVKKKGTATTKKSTTKKASTTRKTSTTKKIATKKVEKDNKVKQEEVKLPKKTAKKAKKEDERIKLIISEQLASLETIKKEDKEKLEEKLEEKVKEKKEARIKNKKEKFDEGKIAKQIEEKKKLPKSEKKKIYKEMTINFLVACFVTVYCIYLNTGFLNIVQDKFIIDLKVFSISFVFIAIIIFEYAYRKDSGRFTMFGIEALITAMVTLVSVYIYMISDFYMIYIYLFSLIALVYSIFKNIFVFSYRKKQYKNTISDVKEIVDENV